MVAWDGLLEEVKARGLTFEMADPAKQPVQNASGKTLLGVKGASLVLGPKNFAVLSRVTEYGDYGPEGLRGNWLQTEKLIGTFDGPKPGSGVLDVAWEFYATAEKYNGSGGGASTAETKGPASSSPWKPEADLLDLHKYPQTAKRLKDFDVMERQLAGGKKPCLFGAECMRPNCWFAHPGGKPPAGGTSSKKGKAAGKGAAMKGMGKGPMDMMGMGNMGMGNMGMGNPAIGKGMVAKGKGKSKPKGSVQMPCRYGAMCQRADCAFQH